MKLRYLPILVAAALWPSWASAQAVTRVCIPLINANTGFLSCPDVTAANPFPTEAFGIATVAPPTYVEGALSPFSFDLTGNLRTSATLVPAGTQDVNLTKILGAAPSATNPIWVSPATASTPWIMTGSGVAGTAAAGVSTIQGIASMTPVQVSQATASSLNAAVVGTGTAGTAAGGVLTVQGVASMTPIQTALNISPSIANGNGVIIAPSSASTAGITPVVSTAAESNHVLKSSPGNLYTLTTTIGATSGYLMLFDATSLPSNGAVTPKYCLPVTSNGTNGAVALSWNSGPPMVFATGITVGFSTTGCFTLTASTTANFFGQVQ